VYVKSFPAVQSLIKPRRLPGFVRIGVAGAATALMVLLGVPVNGQAHASNQRASSIKSSTNIEAESDFLAYTNAARVQHGLRPLERNVELDRAALAWAQTIGSGKLRHASNLSEGLSADWKKLGENLGRGPGSLAVHHALMNSQSHRANLLDHSFTEFGIAVIQNEGTILVVERFRQRESD
jgi:uncharacterized protein YkwD